MIDELDCPSIREPAPTDVAANSTGWILGTLSPAYWRFLSASVFFDFGIGLFFFIFNLYLAALGFNEKSIGLFTSAFTLGSLAATYPIALIAQRHGLRPIVALCMLGAPCAGSLRVFATSPALQTFSSIFFGTAMAGWAVCTPTALARLTDERNRSFGFSLNFGVGIGSGILAAFIGGHLPGQFARVIPGYTSSDGMRCTLLLACLLVLLGSLPLARSGFLADSAPSRDPATTNTTMPQSRFLVRFLIAFGLWSSVPAGFAPFANVYLARSLGISLPHIGEIFAISQFLQVVAVISTPVFHRVLGMKKTILVVQLAAGMMLVFLSRTFTHFALVAEFVLLNSLQYMAGPSIYTLLMTVTPDQDRSTASAAQSLTSSIVGIVVAALAGTIVVRYGYSKLFLGLGVLAFVAALLVSFIEGPNVSHLCGSREE